MRVNRALYTLARILADAFRFKKLNTQVIS